MGGSQANNARGRTCYGIMDDPRSTVTDLPIHHSYSHRFSPGRVQRRLVEDLRSPGTVASTSSICISSVCCHPSRPGSVIGQGEGVFQQPLAGKYTCFFEPHSSLPDRIPVFSHFSSMNHISAAPTVDDHVPGRTYESTMVDPQSPVTVEPSHPVGSSPGRTHIGFREDPYSPDTAESESCACRPNSCRCQQSRPGPVFGHGEGVFQPLSVGKYSCNLSQHCAPPDQTSLTSTTAAGDNAINIGFPVNVTSDFHTTSARLDPVTYPVGTVKLVNETKLCIYYQNVHGLNTKIDAWFLAVTDCDYDIIVLTETWLVVGVLSTQLFGTVYDVYRHDRDERNSTKDGGGGVLIAVHRRLDSVGVSTRFDTGLEQVWARIKLRDRSIYVCAFYLPPDKVSDSSLIEDHVAAIQSIDLICSDHDELLVFGDYNFPGIRWLNDDAGGARINIGSSRRTPCDLLLMDGMACVNMTQLNLIPHYLGNILDLVFAKSPCHVVSEAPEPLIPADIYHPPLEIVVNVPELPAHVGDELDGRRDFRKMDMTAFANYLANMDWSPVLENGEVDAATNEFVSILNCWIINNVPLMKKPKGPPWGSKTLTASKRRKNSALAKYRKWKTPVLRIQFQQASNFYRLQKKNHYRAYCRKTQGKLRRNPKTFWNFVNSKKCDRGLPASMFKDDSECITSKEKCDLFAEHFASVFQKPASSYSNDGIASTPQNVINLDIFEVTEAMILKASRKLKTSYSAGPDGIPAVVYKNCINHLLVPLVAVLNKSLLQAHFPSCWKDSYMFPVYKKGDKRDIANYRGITSLCAGSKLFEIIVNDYVFFNCKSYISSQQHGFFPGRSVTTNLVEFTSTCILNIERGFQVDAIYTDLKAAFDKIDHHILIAKLRKLGASDRFATWFESYLTCRNLRVRIGTETSESFSNGSGVPQGSNLGPLSFGVFFNDSVVVLPDCQKLLYADDLKLFVIVRAADDCKVLQSMLKNFADWCASNRMTLSIDKCVAISYHRKTTPILYNYHINGVVLERTEAIRDLGVIIDSRLTFNEHREMVIKKANRQLGFIFKISKEFNDVFCMRSLYCSLVRSLLESSSVVWAPYQSYWIDRMEAVQKRFTYLALAKLHWNDPNNLRLLSYDNRLKLLQLDSIESRRRADQAVFVAKILVNEFDSPSLLSRVVLNIPTRPMRNYVLLRLPFHRTNYGMNEPLTAMIREFNNNYDLFDFSKSCLSFKRVILTNLTNVH